MKTLAELSGHPNTFGTRKMSLNQQRSKRHHITLDGSDASFDMTSQKSKLNPLLLADAQRLERTNSIQNLVLTCKNADKKHVRFEDEISNEQPQLVVRGGYKRSDCNLFSQIRDSKQNPPVSFEQIEFKISQRSATREKSNSSKHLPEQKEIQYRLQQQQPKHAKQEQFERLESEMDTDSELLLKQSAQSITEEDEKEIRHQMNSVKEKAISRLAEQIHIPEANLEELMSKLRKEVTKEVDAIIDKTLESKKSLYKRAQLEVKEYFLKVNSKTKRSPGSERTYEGTPCFDERVSNYSFSKSGRRTNDRSTHTSKLNEANVSAFDILSSNKQHNHANSHSRENLMPSLECVRLSEKRDPKTQESNQYCTNSSNCSKQSESSRFTFTVSSKRKGEKTTKRIKDRIISGHRLCDSGDAEEVIVKEFNV